MIDIVNLHFSYGQRPVFSGLNLRLGPGTICGLLGRNGTGKSTLLRNIGGFLFPHEGQITTLGFQPGRRQPAFLQQVILLPETFQLPPISMRQWLKNNAPFYTRFDIEAFHRYAKDFDVPSTPRLTELSYGQQKKAMISFALATNAPLLLMDEPTNGLDIAGKSQFRKIIAGAIDESRSILISTHQVKDLEQLIDRILIIDEGQLIFDQPLASVSDKLLFKLSFDPIEEEQSLYCETSFKGSALILPNTEQKESRPDLEMLYKAITTDPVTINAQFK
jgi:ABC-2 type transport system ATP-binding protein